MFSKTLRYFHIPHLMSLFNVLARARLQNPDCNTIPKAPGNPFLLDVISLFKNQMSSIFQ